MAARQRPVQAQVYAWSVVAVALIGFVISAQGRPAFTHRSLLIFALLTLLTALAWRFPVQFAPQLKVYATAIPTFAAVLLLPLSMAVAAAALGVGAGEVLCRRSLFQSAFNTALVAMNVLAAGTVVAVFSAQGFAHDPGLRSGIVVIAAAAANYVVNTFLVELMGALYQRRSILSGLWERHRSMLLQRAALYLLGAFAALIGDIDPWALLVITVPGWVVYRSLRDGVALRTQTRHAVEQLADIVDKRDRYTAEHSRRVAELAQALALHLGLGAEKAHEIYMAGRVHDVGKIGIRSTTLSKPSSMEDDEWEEMRTHAQIGAQLISGFPDFAAGRAIVLHHHERWDGKGYPDGLKGTEIPLGARVVAVADAFDAMTSSRSYRRAMPLELVYAEIERGRGTQLDPELVDLFLSLLRERPDYVARTESGVDPAARVRPLTSSTG